MVLKKIYSLFLLFLILNLNIVVPAVSYASAEETCSCHLSSADKQCHCEDGCNSCGMHKSQKSGVRSQESENPEMARQAEPANIKGMACSTSPQNSNDVLPILAFPFIIPDFSMAHMQMQVSRFSNLSDNILYGVTLTPSEKPPTV